ncbi:hypothetical protein [Neisseria gonorrhoeae]
MPSENRVGSIIFGGLAVSYSEESRFKRCKQYHSLELETTAQKGQVKENLSLNAFSVKSRYDKIQIT